MIPPKQQSATRVLAPSGTFVARVVEIIYLGTVTSPYKNEDGSEKTVNEVRIKWELPTKLHQFKADSPEQPFLVSRKFTLSLFKKSNLRPFVEGIIGVTLKDEEAENFDVDEIIGKECLLSVGVDENDKGKFNVVKQAIPLPEGTTCPPQVNKSRIISFEKWNEKDFDSLPDFLKKRIEQSKEYKKLVGLDVKQEVRADDVPF